MRVLLCLYHFDNDGSIPNGSHASHSFTGHMKRKKAKKNVGPPKVQNSDAIKKLKARWMMTAIGAGN
jgi:hypothetical protein